MSAEMTKKRTTKPDKGPDPTVNHDWNEQDAYLDEALRETIPASDPISPGHVRHLREKSSQSNS
jgi:hypothetical protein